jgi:phosphocarrier protein HPr
LSNTTTAKVTIANKLGLHARPAMMFVETASKFAADISVCRCDDTETIDGKSIMQMMMLAATQGTDVKITAKGDDADNAIKTLCELVKGKFGED